MFIIFGFKIWEQADVNTSCGWQMSSALKNEIVFPDICEPSGGAFDRHRLTLKVTTSNIRNILMFSAF